MSNFFMGKKGVARLCNLLAPPGVTIMQLIIYNYFFFFFLGRRYLQHDRISKVHHESH